MKFMKAILLLVALVCANMAYAQWDFDNAVPLGFASTPLTKSLAVDLDGNVHAVFRNGTTVRYYMRDETTGNWLAAEIVTDSLSAGQIGEVAIAWNPDSQQPIIVFQSNARIWFAERDANGTWLRQMLGDSTEDAYSPDVACNSVGTIYAVYITDDEGDYQLDYGYYNGLTWEFNDIAADIGDFGLGASPRIAVDQNDAGHVVFRGGNFGSYNAQHATNEQGGSNDWVVTTLTVPHPESYPGDIAADANGGIYCVSSGSEGFGIPRPVYYHYRAPGGDWSFGTDASGNENAGEPIIALDPNGDPHVLSLQISGNFYTGTMFYSTAVWAWQIGVVYGNAEGAPAFAIDAEGYGRVFIPSADGSVYYLKSEVPLVDPGWGPEISIEPDTLAFGAVMVGEDSTLEVTLINPNEAVLRITGFDVVSPVFHLTEEWHTVTLMWGWSTNVDIRFAPLANQFYSAYAVITSDAITSPDTVYITGRGVIPDDASETPLPLVFELKPLYPNPFNSAVNISFTLPRASDVSLKVYDLLGREVSTLFSGSMNAGLHNTQWNCAECAAGIYLFKLEAAGQTYVQKAAYVK